MKVLKFEAHNVMRVSDVKFDLEGHHLFLVGGKNGQGKTSALTALLMALCGRSGMDYPEISLKEGQDKGWVKVQLSGSDELHDSQGFTIELFLKRKRSGQVVEEFRILDSAGDEAPEPRTLLKRLYSLRAFDPLAFENLDRKKKRELLLKLLGLDFSEEKQRYEELYSERTAINREGHRAKARWESMPHHEGAPDEEISTAALMEELERRQGVNAENEVHRDTLKEIERIASDSGTKVNQLAEQIEKLQAKLKEETDRHLVAVKRKAEQQAIVNALVDADEAEVRQQIKDASGINAKVRENHRRREAEEHLNELRQRSESLSSKMQAIKDAQEASMQNASWPIAGLSVDDDGVLFNGLPFEQASKSQRTIISTKIGMALNPELRLLVCQDGSDLDGSTLDALGKLCEEEDFQMLLELVTRTDEDESRCAVVIQDGTTVGENEAA